MDQTPRFRCAHAIPVSPSGISIEMPTFNILFHTGRTLTPWLDCLQAPPGLRNYSGSTLAFSYVGTQGIWPPLSLGGSCSVCRRHLLELPLWYSPKFLLDLVYKRNSKLDFTGIMDHCSCSYSYVGCRMSTFCS